MFWAGAESTRKAAQRVAIDTFRGLVTFDPSVWNLAALRGKNLGCWCPLDMPCHADVLLDLANAD